MFGRYIFLSTLAKAFFHDCRPPLCVGRKYFISLSAIHLFIIRDANEINKKMQMFARLVIKSVNLATCTIMLAKTRFYLSYEKMINLATSICKNPTISWVTDMNIQISLTNIKQKGRYGRSNMNLFVFLHLMTLDIKRRKFIYLYNIHQWSAQILSVFETLLLCNSI